MFTRLAEQSWFPVISALLSQGLFALVAIKLPQMLGKEGFGEYQTVLAAMQWPLIVAVFPVALVLPKYLSQTTGDRPVQQLYFGSSMVVRLISTVVALAVLLGAATVLSRLYRLESLRWEMLLIGLGMVLFHPLAMHFLSALQGHGRPRLWAAVNVAGVVGVVSLILLGGSLYKHYGLMGLAVPALVCWVPFCIVSGVALWRVQGYLVTFRASRSAVWRMIRDATPLLLATTGFLGAKSVVISFLVNSLDDGKVQVGYFELAATQFFMLFVVVSTGVSIPLLPDWSRLYEKGQYRTLFRHFDGALVVLVAVGCALAAVVWVEAEWIVLGLWGESFRAFIPVLKVSVLWWPLYMIGFSFYLLGIAMGRTMKVMWANCMHGVVLVVVGWFLAPDGARGMVWAFLIGYVVWTALYTFLGVRDLRYLLREARAEKDRRQKDRSSSD